MTKHCHQADNTKTVVVVVRAGGVLLLVIGLTDSLITGDDARGRPADGAVGLAIQHTVDAAAGVVVGG